MEHNHTRMCTYMWANTLTDQVCVCMHMYAICNATVKCSRLITSTYALEWIIPFMVLNAPVNLFARLYTSRICKAKLLLPFNFPRFPFIIILTTNYSTLILNQIWKTSGLHMRQTWKTRNVNALGAWGTASWRLSSFTKSIAFYCKCFQKGASASLPSSTIDTDSWSWNSR